MKPQDPGGAGCVDVVAVDLGALVQRARGGDRGAWDEIVDRCLPVVWAAALDIGLSPNDATNAIEITWLRLLDGVHAFTDTGTVEQWLVSTCRDEARRVLALPRRTGGHAVVAGRPTVA